MPCMLCHITMPPGRDLSAPVTEQESCDGLRPPKDSRIECLLRVCRSRGPIVAFAIFWIQDLRANLGPATPTGGREAIQTMRPREEHWDPLEKLQVTARRRFLPPRLADPPAPDVRTAKGRKPAAACTAGTLLLQIATIQNMIRLSRQSGQSLRHATSISHNCEGGRCRKQFNPVHTHCATVNCDTQNQLLRAGSRCINSLGLARAPLLMVLPFLPDNYCTALCTALWPLTVSLLPGAV